MQRFKRQEDCGGVLGNLFDDSEESEPEPEPAKKKTSCKRRVKKKVTLSADDNIIFDDPDAALELAKSICQTETKEAKATRKVPMRHQHTPSAPKSKPATSKTKLKGARLSYTPQRIRVCFRHFTKLLRKVRRQSKTTSTRGSNEGTSSKPGVPDESTVVSDTSSEGTGAKPGVPDKDKDITEGKDDKDGDVDDEGDDHVTDIAKEEAEKTLEAIDDTKKTELPSSSSSLFVSSCFGDQFLKLSSDSSLVSIIKDSADTDVISTDVPSPQVTPIFSSIQQTPTPIPTQPITTDALTIITAVHESDAISAVKLRVAKLEKDMSKLKTIDHSSEALVVLQSQVPTIIDSYLDTKVGDVFHKELQKYTGDLNHKYSLQHLLELTKKLTPTAEQESEKSPSEFSRLRRK
ncbi:hypothetical protein Tco_1030955 [Tanacetum coccineum]|uniref:Uncharacterized protein n=1 Tax=Tanacetum coccineum TaxID=301880 RepID=A0ABQ5G8F2_9ASTR